MGKRRKPFGQSYDDLEVAHRIDQLDEDLGRAGYPVIMTIKQTAKAAGHHYQYIWEQIQAGYIKAHKPGGQWRVLRRDMARWIIGK
jgi:excisionase family DNA binding protein